METIIQEMLGKKKWAVVGANQNPSKYGNKIFNKLRRFGYEVYPVNPKYDEIEGVNCYDQISDLPVEVDCVSVVVPPALSNALVDEVKSLGIERIWFQPGTFTPEIVEKSEVMGLKTVYFDCVLVELDKRGSLL
jgi:predicted CoA-binding protein